MRHLENIEAKQIIPGDDELLPERLEEESDWADDLQAFLSGQVDRIADQVQPGLFGEPGRDPLREFWEDELGLLLALLSLIVIQFVERGISAAVGRIGSVGLGVDEQVNIEAEKWARRHALRLAKGLNKTTRTLARQRIAAWVAGGTNDRAALVDSLSEIIGPRWRAEMIAQTEITRAYGEAHRIVGDRTKGIKYTIWWTARDERVCPVCAPLHGAKIRKGGTFPGGFRSPPAHPRCRCGVTFETTET